MMAALPDPRRLASIIRMFGTPIEGERLSAVAALARVLNSGGATFDDLAAYVAQAAPTSFAPMRPRPPTTWPARYAEVSEAARRAWIEALRKRGGLSAWERGFLDNLAAQAASGRGWISPRQVARLDEIAARQFGGRAA